MKPLLAATLAFITAIAHAKDPLPSWNGTAAKRAVTDFLSEVIREGSRDFLPQAERIAVFDNDGYLVCLNFKTGAVQWDERDPGKRRAAKGALAAADGRLYYRTEQGTLLLVEVNPKEYVERGRFEQPDRTSKPA